jgi:hypothetical protein
VTRLNHGAVLAHAPLDLPRRRAVLCIPFRRAHAPIARMRVRVRRLPEAPVARAIQVGAARPVRARHVGVRLVRARVRVTGQRARRADSRADRGLAPLTRVLAIRTAGRAARHRFTRGLAAAAKCGTKIGIQVTRDLQWRENQGTAIYKNTCDVPRPVVILKDAKAVLTNLAIRRLQR